MEMPQIRPRVAPAGVAAALRIRRVVVLGVARVPYVQTSLAGEELPVARVTSREHAIEHVDPSRYALDKVLRRPGSHEIARLPNRKPACGLPHDLVHEVDRLADAQTPECVSLEPDGHRGVGALAAKIRKHAALHDAELCLTRVADDDVRDTRGAKELEATAAAPRPANRSLHRHRRLFTGCRVSKALVQDHRDIRPESRLDVDRALRREVTL